MPRILPGTSDGIIRENVRSLKQQGYSEVEAIARANKRRADPDEPDASDESTELGVDDSEASDRQFVIVTKDFSGLGWAKKLQEEGETVTLAHRWSPKAETDPKDRQRYDQIGKGWLTTMELSEALRTLRTDSTYWIFAENNFPEEADALRAQGQKVFGTSALSNKLEHDRHYAIEVADEHGLPSPPCESFSSRQEGLAFLDANPDTAYVFKPDDGKFNYMTFVPVRERGEDANREGHTYLSHMKQEPGAYILQERVTGVEVNVECWLYEGEPFLAFACLESKRKNNWDLGEMAGCAGDFAWSISVNSKLCQQTIGKMLPFYKEQKYTGFADVNVILGDHGPVFLEVCNRFGYNGHVTLFLGLALDGFGSIIADYIDGYLEGMDDRFRQGVIASSLSLFLEHPREGLPVHISDQFVEQFFPFDGYKEQETFLLTGYSNEVGILVDCSAHTVHEAAQEVLNNLTHKEAVSFPDMYYRTDLGERNYSNAPNSRWHALQAKQLLGVQ